MIVNKYGGNGGGGYVLPVASQSTLGGVKIGEGLSIDSGGTLSSEGKPAIYINDMSQAELAAFYADILPYSGSTEKILETYDIFYYITSGPNSDKDFFKTTDIAFGSNKFKFRGEDVIFDSSYIGVFDKIMLVELSSNGKITANLDEYCKVLSVNASGTGHTLSFDKASFGAYWSRIADGNVPISLRLVNEKVTTTKCSLIREQSTDDAYLYAEWTDLSGVTYEAKWKFANNETPVYFREKQAAGGDYQIVEALSAITNPVEGMMVYVPGGEIYCDKLAVIGASELSGWAHGVYNFVQGEDYTMSRINTDGIWKFSYKTGHPQFTYYWTELEPDVYIRYIGGELQVAWKSETYPNATMQGNNFTNSDHKWGEVSGGIYVSLDHDAGLHIYENGRWNPTKKSYHIQDLVSSTALTKEICDRTSDGEMDIRLFDRNGTFTCTQSTPNSWNSGETNFVEFRPDTNSNKVLLYRKFIHWNNYALNQDAVWESGLIGLYVGEFGFKYDIDNSKLYRQGSEVTASGIMPYGSFNPGHISRQLSGGELPYYKLEVVESGLTTAYAYPSISNGELASPVTIDDETFSNEFVLDYGKYIVKVYLNNDFGANFRLFKRTETQV